MEFLAGAAALLTVSLSVARMGSQLQATVARGDAAMGISRRNRLLSAACATAGLSCSWLSGIEGWIACASLLNAATSLIALWSHSGSLSARSLDRTNEAGDQT